MNKYQKIVLGVLAAVVVIATGSYYISYRIDTRTPETDQSIEEIVEKNKEDLESEVSTSEKIKAEDIYERIHKMANTIIVAEDGLIYGKIKINDESINNAMAIVKDSTVIEEDERLVFMNILQDWKEGDFSSGVRDHNYAWKD